MKCKKFFSFAAIAVMLASFAAGPAAAADYSSWPEDDIRIIYYTKAGSGGDLFLRQLAAALHDKLNGHQLLIENIIDQTGRAAWSRVQKAKPDGYTLAGLSTTVVTADLVGNSPVKYKDFDWRNSLIIVRKIPERYVGRHQLRPAPARSAPFL